MRKLVCLDLNRFICKMNKWILIASEEAERAEVRSAGFDYSLYKMLPTEIAG